MGFSDRNSCQRFPTLFECATKASGQHNKAWHYAGRKSLSKEEEQRPQGDGALVQCFCKTFSGESDGDVYFQNVHGQCGVSHPHPLLVYSNNDADNECTSAHRRAILVLLKNVHTLRHDNEANKGCTSARRRAALLLYKATNALQHA